MLPYIFHSQKFFSHEWASEDAVDIKVTFFFDFSVF
jgi:hypothetical protein